MEMTLWNFYHEDNNCGYDSNLYGIYTWNNVSDNTLVPRGYSLIWLKHLSYIQ